MSPLPPARAQSSPDVCGGTDGPKTPPAAHKRRTLAVVQRKKENSLLLNFCPPCHSLRALWRAAVLTYGHVAHFAIISLLAQLALSRCPGGKSFPLAVTWDMSSSEEMKISISPGGGSCFHPCRLLLWGCVPHTFAQVLQPVLRGATCSDPQKSHLLAPALPASRSTP